MFLHGAELRWMERDEFNEIEDKERHGREEES